MPWLGRRAVQLCILRRHWEYPRHKDGASLVELSFVQFHLLEQDPSTISFILSLVPTLMCFLPALNCLDIERTCETFVT